MRLLNTILNIVFPRKCLACGKSGPELCLLCLGDCPEAERECAPWIFPLYDYRHPPIKKALYLLKYRGKKKIAEIFTDNLYGKIMEELADLLVMENFDNPILIPIPLSNTRQGKRGYNQTELICKELVLANQERRGINIELKNNILIKTKDTQNQASIENRKERLQNIIGSFAVNPKTKNEVSGRNIILIDDITTTGATLAEARKMLENSGVRKVIAFTIAH
jgi:ComF family protein